MTTLQQRKSSQPKKIIKRKKITYEIEDILDEEVINGKKFYFIKWLGYPKNQSTWEPEENFVNEIEQINKEIPKKKILKKTKNDVVYLHTITVIFCFRRTFSTFLIIAFSK